MQRLNEVHWDWLVYVEMFVAGIAAGAYVTAAILELFGRGRSPVARTAHALAFPLMAVAGLLLIVDLNRPERFWHMLIQSETLRPMLKWWSPMSAGSLAVFLFSGFAFVSFVDMLVAQGRLRLGGWNRRRTLHGSPLGLVWALLGSGVAFFIAAYSGVLLSVTNIPGWRDSTLIGGLYIAIAGATGMAALLLIQALRGRADAPLTAALERANSLLLVYELVALVAFLISAQPAADLFLRGLPLVAIVAAVILGILLPLGLRVARRRPPALVAATAALILVGGLLLRYAIVMGPQYALG